MKEKILAALKTKFVGVQDAILGRVAEKLSKTVKTDEEVTTAVEGVTLQQVIDSYGDVRATEASQTAVKTFREKYGIGEDGKPIQKGGDPNPKPGDPEPDPNEPAWAKALREELKLVRTKTEAIEKTKTQEVLTGKFIAKLKEKGVDEDFIPLLTRNLSIDSEDKIEQLVTDTENVYKEIVQKKADKGVVLSIPASSQGAGVEDALGKGIAEKKNRTTKEAVTEKKKL